MTEPRFFCPVPLSPGQTLTLPESVAHHVRVLRLAQGAHVTLFDGRRGEISGILRFEAKQTLISLGEFNPREAELGGEITIYQGLASGDKMDWVVEKCVELGVSKLVPIAAQRSVLQLSGARLEKRLQHWQRIAQAAAEQCGRNRLMSIAAPCQLTQALNDVSPGLRLFCDPQAGIDLKIALDDASVSEKKTKSVELFVGPEGGWSETECRLTLQSGAKAVRFGNRVLRTETAGLALVSAVTALMDW